MSGNGGGGGSSGSGGDEPLLLDSWVALEEGGYTGSVAGRGTVWLRAVTVESGVGGHPVRVQSLNGECFILGTLASSGAVKVSDGNNNDVDSRPPSLDGMAWPILVVIASLVLSTTYGVVPGTCIGPAATGVTRAAESARPLEITQGQQTS